MRSGIMLCYPFEESRLTKWNTKTFLVQPKLDGERCRAVFDVAGNVTLYSSEQNIITSVPHINEQLETLQLQNMELDGELYVHGKPFEQIHSIVGRTVNQHYNSESMQYHVFDIVSRENQLSRMVTLSNIVYLTKTCPSIEVVPVVAVSSLEKLMDCFHTYVDAGYEGFIVRHPAALYVRKRSTYIMKFKPKKNDIYEIIGVQEEVSIQNVPKGTLGAFICKGDDDTHFNVGSGLTADQRREYWKIKESLIGMYCQVEYQHITAKHVPRFPIFVKVIKDLIGGTI
jgi:ATP-dependent DNA ligase